MAEVDLGCVHGVGDRVELRPLNAADGELYVRLYTDERCMRWIGPPLDRATVRRSFAAALAGKGPWRAVIVERPGSQGIGLVAIDATASGSLEIGVMLDGPACGRGLARAALERVLTALDEQRPARICMRVQAGNAPMLRLASALRFRVVAGPADQPGWLLMEAAP